MRLCAAWLGRNAQHHYNAPPHAHVSAAMLEIGNGVGPAGRQLRAGACGGVESGHNSRGHTFHIACGGIVDALLQNEAVGGDALGGCGDFKRFIEIGRREERRIYVDYHHGKLTRIGRMPQQRLEITNFAKIEQLHVDRVIDMAKHVDVIEPELRIDGMMKFDGRLQHFGICARGKYDGF